MTSAHAIDLKSTIVTGSDLRVLLGSDHLSYGEVYSALKEKGVFVGNADKSITVPLLSATLLTPDDFTRLIEGSVNRESQPKIKVAGINLVSDNKDWISPLKKSLFDTSFDALGSTSGIDFSKNPSLVVYGPNKISIPYQIRRQDYSKDWIQRELNFDGHVVVEKQGSNLKLEFTSTHSSKETELVNKRITNRIAKVLHDEKLVSTDKPMSITFGSLSNEERVRYFKRLTSGYNSILSAGRVNDIEICLDPNGPALPNDPEISWMKQTVRKLNVDGDRLNDIFLISDEKYYKHYHIQRMDVTFPFNVDANSGECRVSFSFSGGGRSTQENSELIFECAKWTHNEQPNLDAKKKISSEIQYAIRSIIEQKYNIAIQERTQNTSSATTT
ncbi:hypothetical protein KDW41_00110 [Burkholderia vietnamiensis]|uniref:GapS4b family protein n=1 Tax=Burkholderia vietnamiensis TaxID=60552 RepID=UPI001B97EBF1|nr:hypothetical protein [Burkholderia vietnamiensis]MBR7958853.1 hypothetical protein [Burkholderia vietnamiensis]MBR7973803.1 hypothetical protein [Burkholderia vietnamiensis]MBR8359370.1 hypothetical protein [Burkholderia vietnamiensis]MDN8041801.1 hypothetical protein [Burkholderia vietnamiensis]